MNNSRQTLVFDLTGRVDADDFAEWIKRHAWKLGVDFRIRQRLPHLVSIEATGAREMVEAFALACSLGPKSVCIERLVVSQATVPEK